MTVWFGLQGSGQLTSGVPDPGRFRAVAELAEELGYDSLWAGEHLSFHNPILDVVVALSAFAAWTSRIRLGAGVVLLPLRHPSLVAKQMASLDYLSGGRVILGIGVGGEGAKDFEAAGVPIAERGARADEGIAALRAIFGPSPATFHGIHYAFDDIAVAPRAVQPGGPPILVAGTRPGALRRAGRLGDGWLPYMISARRYAESLGIVRTHARKAGRDPGALSCAVVLFALVREDGQAAREEARAHLSTRYGMQFEAHQIEKLCIVGSPEECVAKVEAYIEAGARHFSLNPCAAGDDFLDQCEALSECVVEPVRRGFS
ncbi:MAG: LLM class flavin-dependent oxidoreductase [Thermoleophilia bacterium]|nr:LLM class flavin-dependent oxidoreductase [Thermoleophilia bacterium]